MDEQDCTICQFELTAIASPFQSPRASNCRTSRKHTNDSFGKELERRPWLSLIDRVRPEALPSLAILPYCNHAFHSDCILQHIYAQKKKSEAACPNCRQSIRFTDCKPGTSQRFPLLVLVPDNLLSMNTINNAKAGSNGGNSKNVVILDGDDEEDVESHPLGSSKEPIVIDDAAIMAKAGQQGPPNIVQLLHRDLSKRTSQIAEMELQIRQLQFQLLNSDGHHDFSDSDVELNSEEREELLDLRRRVGEMRELRARQQNDVVQLRHQAQTIADLNQNVVSLNLSVAGLKEKLQATLGSLSQFQEKYHKLTAENANNLKKLAAFKVTQEVALDGRDTRILPGEWAEKLALMEKSNPSVGELQTLLRALFNVLKDTTIEHDTFRDRSYKLNKEKGLLSAQIKSLEDQISDLKFKSSSSSTQKKGIVQTSLSTNIMAKSNVSVITLKSNSDLINKTPVMPGGSAFAPRKRKVETSSAANTSRGISNGLGGSIKKSSFTNFGKL